MDDKQFKQWIVDVRSKIVEVWDEHNIPPVIGYSEEEILDQFNILHSHPVHEMFVKDELTGDTCVRNTHNKLGNACNSWFPTMMKTKIDYGTAKREPKSIYDFMKEDELLEKYMPYGYRHFKRDSFYAYSQCVPAGSALPSLPEMKTVSASDYVEKFHEFERPYDTHEIWISPKAKDKKYTGYNEALINAKFYQLTYNELALLMGFGKLKRINLTNVKEYSDNYVYEIRLYKKGQKIFPIGLKSFRISVCQAAVNFPPLIAKAIWERYTEEFKNDDEVIVWDPSAGWAGRLLGALAVKDDRNIRYLACDPNTDHTISKEILSGGYGMTDREKIYTKYDDLAKFYKTKSSRATGLFPHLNEHKVWQCGSEEMQNQEDFWKYKGKVSVVFTSPPYFRREVYSQDAEQSCHKFSAYEDWRDNFLYETLKTAVEYLRPGGYICWNIADVKEGKTFVPLEKDSCDIMEKLGMEKVEVLKLVLGQMPGGNRTQVDEDTGAVTSTNKNSVRLNGSYFRYEPIFVYRKKVI